MPNVCLEETIPTLPLNMMTACPHTYVRYTECEYMYHQQKRWYNNIVFLSTGFYPRRNFFNALNHFPVKRHAHFW